MLSHCFSFLKELRVTMLQKLKHMSVILKFTHCILVITTQEQENLMNSYILEINVLAIREQKGKIQELNAHYLSKGSQNP